MSRKGNRVDRKWFCKLLSRDIEEGACLEINYERLGFFDGTSLTAAQRETGLDVKEVGQICDSCPFQPLDS